MNPSELPNGWEWVVPCADYLNRCKLGMSPEEERRVYRLTFATRQHQEAYHSHLLHYLNSRGYSAKIQEWGFGRKRQRKLAICRG